MPEDVSNPVFTIITPVYNGLPFIQETIDSVLSFSKDRDFEYIIVNDGSTDGTGEFLSRYVGKVQIINQENQGEAASVNRGLLSGSGRFALIVSADDPMRSAKLLDDAKAILDADKSIVCVYPDWSVIDSKSRVIRDVNVPEYSEKKLIGEFNCLVGPGGVFRRDVAIQIGGRDSRFRFTSDYDFWLRLSRKGRFQRIPEFLAYWREHESSTSIAFRGLEMGTERIDVIENFLESNIDLPRSIKKMARGYSHMQAALLVYFDKTIPAKRWLLKSLFYYPMGLFRFNPRVILYVISFPVSARLLSLLKKRGLYRKLP